MEASEADVKKQINEVLALLKKVLKNDLLGLYLNGSLVFGGEGKYSDIDLIAVSSRATDLNEKAHLETELLKISGKYGISRDRRPVELYILKRSEINPWNYPPKFDFLYGDWLRKEFEGGKVEPWKSKENPGLAVSVTQLLLSHKIIYGSNPSELFPKIPYKDFMLANIDEIDSLILDLESDTRNVLLTLARVWATLETESIYSKSAAAEYVVKKLHSNLARVLEHARLVALGVEKEDWGQFGDGVRICAEYMVLKIKQLWDSIDLNPERKIKLAREHNS